MIIDLLLSSIIAFIFSFTLAPIAIRIAEKYKLVDDPNRRYHPAHTHRGIIPRAGGIGIFFAIIITSLLYLSFNKIILSIIVGGCLILLMGLLDDRYDLSPYWRFTFSLIIVALVVNSGLGIPYITNPLGGVLRLDEIIFKTNILGPHTYLLFANLLSIIWIVFMMNAVNWSKGVDGQLPGFVAISCIIIGLLAWRFSAHDIDRNQVMILSFIVGFSYLGFLPWNFYPQKIMPGYSGGALAGYFLGILSILSWSKVGTLVLVLTIPLIDALSVMLSRLKSKKSPFRGDANHLHHRLLRIGWGRRRIAVFYWIASLLFGIAALFSQHEQKLIIFIFLLIMISLFIVIIEKIKENNVTS